MSGVAFPSVLFQVEKEKKKKTEPAPSELTGRENVSGVKSKTKRGKRKER